MDSFVGRSQDVTVIGERRRKITLFIIICTACERPTKLSIYNSSVPLLFTAK